LKAMYLKPEAEIAAKRILCVLGMEFTDVKFSPLVPEVGVLLYHFCCTYNV